MKNNLKIGKDILFTVATGILWGATGIVAKVLASWGFTPMQTTAVRISVSAICLLLWCLFFKRSAFRIEKASQFFLFLGSGVSLLGISTLYFMSLTRISVSAAIVLMYTAPIPVMFFSVLFLGEKLNSRKLIAVATMLAGCVLVSGIVGGFTPDLLGIIFGLLSGLSYAAYNILTKDEMRTGCDPVSASLYSFLFASIISIILSNPWTMPALIAERPLQFFSVALVFGPVTFIAPFILYTLALRTLPVGTASALSIVEPMAASVMSMIFFHEPPTLPLLAGIILIIGSTLLLSFAEPNRDKKHSDP